MCGPWARISSTTLQAQNWHCNMISRLFVTLLQEALLGWIYIIKPKMLLNLPLSMNGVSICKYFNFIRINSAEFQTISPHILYTQHRAGRQMKNHYNLCLIETYTVIGYIKYRTIQGSKFDKNTENYKSILFLSRQGETEGYKQTFFKTQFKCYFINSLSKYLFSSHNVLSTWNRHGS